MDLAEASVVVAVVGGLSGIIGILIQGHRERQNVAAAASRDTEDRMEKVLRERIAWQKDQIEALKSELADARAEGAHQQVQITELTERLGVLVQEVHRE